jgi:hypothetical protein
MAPEHAVEAEAERASPPAAASVRNPAATPRVARVVALQQAAGNRAVTRALARADMVSGDVEKEIREDLVTPSAKGETSFHWTTKFHWEIDDDAVRAWINLGLTTAGDIDYEVAKAVRQDAMEAFRKTFNDKFDIVEPGHIWDTKRRLLIGITWVFGGPDAVTPDATITLHPGAPSNTDPYDRTNRTNWHVAEPAKVHAHEAGHLFGLLDEYVDTNVVGRSDSGKPGVREDHSIMGDYEKEGGIDTATMKDRHALRIAKLIYAAAGRDHAKLQATKR